jgi:hypothetical protein
MDFFLLLASKTIFGVIEDICPQFRPVVGRRNPDVGFQSGIVTIKLVVMGFAKCTFCSTFLEDIELYRGTCSHPV